ncbi:MAG: M28 family peptidase [Bacteroidetes bacterium]|nr:M28 family peptidase [Bacteroidota bacterium]
MKFLLPVVLLTTTWGECTYAQNNQAVSSAEVNKILLGTYNPVNYQATTVITDPGVISAGLLSQISTDSLKADLYALAGFRNRNTFSDTTSTTRGIGAARRWIYSKFQQYSSANEGRLKPAYLWFDYSPSSAGCSGSITRHANVMAVLPGSQTANPSLIIVEGHMDSRNADNCDVTGSALGIGDNATGTALVMELARVLSQYTFRSTIVFSVNTGEEQGLIGASALANYLDGKNVRIKAVNNNDVAGGVFCGHTASSPGCPFYGDIDSTDIRIFSLGTVNSAHKQWARYVKLEYKEQLMNQVSVPMNINIMQNEDRSGRGGDHQAFSALSYTAVRFTQANEDGNGSTSSSYQDRQHNIRDSLGRDSNGDGQVDSLYVNLDYLSRNTLINGNSLAMVALGPDTVNITPTVLTANLVRVKFNPSSGVSNPGYRIAIRSNSNDWDSVYTVSGLVDTIAVPYPMNTNFYISAAAMDANNTESQFATEFTLSTKQYVLSLPPPDPRLPAPADAGYYGIRLMPNRPNPFDESTTVAITSGTDVFSDRTWLQFTTLDGRVIRRMQVQLKKGLNEVLLDHGFTVAGTYVCSLIIDGLPAQSTKMLFRR